MSGFLVAVSSVSRWPSAVSRGVLKRVGPIVLFELGLVAATELLELHRVVADHLRSAVDGATCWHHSPRSALVLVTPRGQRLSTSTRTPSLASVVVNPAHAYVRFARHRHVPFVSLCIYLGSPNRA